MPDRIVGLLQAVNAHQRANPRCTIACAHTIDEILAQADIEARAARFFIDIMVPARCRIGNNRVGAELIMALDRDQEAVIMVIADRFPALAAYQELLRDRFELEPIDGQVTMMRIPQLRATVHLTTPATPEVRDGGVRGLNPTVVIVDDVEVTEEMMVGIIGMLRTPRALAYRIRYA